MSGHRAAVFSPEESVHTFGWESSHDKRIRHSHLLELSDFILFPLESLQGFLVLQLQLLPSSRNIFHVLEDKKQALTYALHASDPVPGVAAKAGLVTEPS